MFGDLQNQVEAKVPITKKLILEHLDLIRGAVLICFPQARATRLPCLQFADASLHGKGVTTLHLALWLHPRT